VPLGRNPMTLAKELAQIDRLSAGRVLLAFVPGVDQPGERAALGIDDGQRMVAFDESIDLCRRFWSGESVDHEGHRLAYRSITVKPLPVQQPIEIWLGGRGAAALRRAGRLADGWLGAGVTPTEAPAALAQINAAATEAGRTIDPEHFGISLPYCHDEPPAALVESMATRYKGADVSELIPVGMEGLRRLVDRYLAAGVSKFVIRPVGGTGSPREELGRLADVLLPMQT
jgi:probable F420-dependent oxidoreductase